MKSAPAKRFSYVQEQEDPFLSLFPHRFDYIYAPHPEPGETPAWRTESRHPLSDRVLQQGQFLYGVRFGSQTQYCLLDIDRGSAYHPDRDPFAIARIQTALEAIGLTSYLACTSSYSGGLHLYFPFSTSCSAWELATVISLLLGNSGFALKPGQLELFPNPKPYIVEGTPSLFNAHRLPLQAGSYLLNDDFQPIWSDRSAFVQRWQWTQQSNFLDVVCLKRLLKQARRKHYRISGKADKFINDLNAEIEFGWTGKGQTNRLLGRITMRTYIFHHVLEGGVPLVGKPLVEAIVQTARSLPGYQEWCGHQHEIEQRAEEWARCIENSHYFAYGDTKGKYKTKAEAESVESELASVLQSLPSWNQQQAEGARERIRAAIAQMLEAGHLPAQATARFRALTQFGIGGGSLYRHRDLWHPNHLGENPPHPPASDQNVQEDRVEDASPWDNSTSLLLALACNSLRGQGSGDRAASHPQTSGGNSLSEVAKANASHDVHFWQAGHAAAQEKVAQEKVTQERAAQRQAAAQAGQAQRMQQYLSSQDPILMAEAIAWTEVNPWAEVNPGVLEHKVPEQSMMPSHRQDESGDPGWDLSDVLAAISVHLRRLGWSLEQKRHSLQVLFQQSSQARLSEGELLHWLGWLEQISP